MTEDIQTTPPKYASLNVRLIASTIDLAIIMFFATPIVALIINSLFQPVHVNTEQFAARLHADNIQDPHVMMAQFWAFVIEHNILQQLFFESILQIIFIGIYILPFWFHYSATPGKRLLRLEIRDATTGEWMTRKQSMLRFLGYIVSAIPLTLGFAWILFNKKRQGFHDKIANTIVIVKPRKKKVKMEEKIKESMNLES